jgi:hypothetical protein
MSNRFKESIKTLCLMVTVIALAGCSPTTPAKEPSTALPLAPEAPSVAEEFAAIAARSCESAMSLGVQEVTEDLGITAVMIPKDKSVEGHSAAYFQEPDVFELVWETGFFFSCGVSNEMDQLKEIGKEQSIEVSKDESSYTLWTLGEQTKVPPTVYFVDKYLFSKVVSSSDGTQVSTEISYGADLEASKKLINSALERLHNEN